jgi:hypothetical protein
MNQKFLFSFLIMLLAVCSSMYVGKSSRERTNSETVAVMAGICGHEAEENPGLTFTDLAETVNSAFNTEVRG